MAITVFLRAAPPSKPRMKLMMGRISVNGRPAKAGYEVKVGDQIAITMGPRVLAVEVVQVSENVRKDDAGAMYKEI